LSDPTGSGIYVALMARMTRRGSESTAQDMYGKLRRVEEDMLIVRDDKETQEFDRAEE